MSWTEEQVALMAPDASSLKSGLDLANESKWLVLHGTDRVLWGTVQGSGSTPYKTQVDVQSVAFKCSCPSRKFPCKHGLGLLFLHTRKGGFSTAPEPEWVRDWMDKREQKAEAKANPTEEVLDEKTIERRAKDKEKRAASRSASIEEGVAEFDLVLRDQIRTGLLHLPDKAYQLFHKLGTRMIDAKAPGLAVVARRLRDISWYGGTDWQAESLEQMAKAHLLLEGYRRIDTLPQALAIEVQTRIGLTHKKEELLADANALRVADTWLVVAKYSEQEEQLVVWRHWLLGLKTGKWALLLDFAGPHQPLTTMLMPGNCVQAEMCYYPSAEPMRVQVVEQGAQSAWKLSQSLPAHTDWQSVQKQYAAVLATNPFSSEQPTAIEQCTWSRNGTEWLLTDCTGQSMPLHKRSAENQVLRALAITGNEAAAYFGLVLDRRFWPLALIHGGKMSTL